ncbi:MAG: 2'-5' RNA ligase family protein [Nanobdellota archaeon]
MTLVYPFEAGQRQLDDHIQQSIKPFAPFDITLSGLKRSAKGFYLYLCVSMGNDRIVALHKALHTGILRDCHNPDMPTYIPHMTLGIFENDDHRTAAMQNIPQLSVTTRIDTIQLITVEDQEITLQKDFSL